MTKPKKKVQTKSAKESDTKKELKAKNSINKISAKKKDNKVISSEIDNPFGGAIPSFLLVNVKKAKTSV